MKKVPWNREIYREFVSLSFLTEEEERILQSRIDGWNQTAQAYELHISLATLNRRIRRLKDKYNSAAEYNEKLPKNLEF